MRYAVTTETEDAASMPVDCVVVPRHLGPRMAERFDIGGQMSALLSATDNKAGASSVAYRQQQPGWLVAVGRNGADADAGDGNGADGANGANGANGKDPQAKALADFRKDMQAAASTIAKLDGGDAAIFLDAFEVDGIDAYRKARIALDAVSHASYRFDRYKSKSNGKKPARVVLATRHEAEAQRAARHAAALEQGLAATRDLGNQPPNICDPAHLADVAQELAADQRVSVEVIDESQMEELGMGSFLSVTRGSERPGKLILVHYRGGAEDEKPVAIVGKGITFDTGGVDLKNVASMEDMKYDMCGAATVLGVAKAAIAADLPLNLIAVAAAAENMPSGSASRPSDIVTTLSGQTVEILNTDAEGRLVLCDALTYIERYEPRAVVDVATLTGAQIVALGEHASALYANDEELAAALIAAGEHTNDRIWRMPLWDEYQESLESKYADMKNIGGGGAGSVTAACFLARFAGKFRWAHLDVAGTAFGKKKGATGRPTSALFEYLLSAVDANAA